MVKRWQWNSPGMPDEVVDAKDYDAAIAALRKANESTERFEREWYLCQDELEKPCKGCGQ